MEDLVGKFVNSAKTTTTTVGAAAKKGTNLVKRINPRPQQTEVASPEASQGMASIILGAIGYQQTRREETAGEGSDTSEAIDGETSSNQEVINETAEVMNNDDIPESPLPVNNGDNQTENSVIDKMKTEYVDIKNISDPAQRKTMFEQFFTPNDDKETTLKKAYLISDDLKKNSAPNEIIKDALEAFLKNPSNDNDVLIQQSYLASSSVLNKILNKDDKEIIINLLKNPSSNNDALILQSYLASSSVLNKIFNKDDKKIIINLLNKHSDDKDVLIHQCNLAVVAVEKGILKAEEPTDKEIITNLLKNPSNDENVLKQQYNLANFAIRKKMLNKDDKNILINLLKKPSDDKEVLKYKYKLANTLIKNGFMEPEELKEVLDKIKNLILGQKITVAKNLSYLTNDQLKSINEAKLLQDSENENKQFKLEYFIDLKISRGLYDNWYDLANVIKNNAKILTPEDDSNILTPKDNRNIYDDGVYNLTVIALKQMPLDKRNGFLSSIYKYTYNSNLKGLLTNDNKCDNEKLLTIRPVLKQYENQDVSRNFSNLSHDYRIPRTTDKCEVFEENGQRYLGYQGTNQRIKTDLSQKQIEYLFGEQRPNGNQAIGNCWLISKLKEFNYDPELKLFIMSRFSMDKNGDVSITLKNGNKVTFPKDIVEKATKTVNDEHLSPAMACLSLLAALNRTRENTEADISADTYGIFNKNIIANEDYLKQQFKKENIHAFRRTSNKSLKPLTDSKDPISYALRKYNDGGDQYYDLLSLFFDEAQNPDSNKENFIIKSTLNTYHHAWSHYDDNLAANPQNSNTLFIKKGEVLSTYPSDASRQDVFGIDKHYYVPKIDIKK